MTLFRNADLRCYISLICHSDEYLLDVLGSDPDLHYYKNLREEAETVFSLTEH